MKDFDDNDNTEVDMSNQSERLVSDTDVEIQTSPSRMNPTSVRFEGMLVEIINPTTLTIDWCPVLNSDSLRGYKIRYAMKDMSSYNERFVSPGISNYTITGLRPNTEYVISVYAVDENEAILRNCGFGTHKTDEIEGTANAGPMPYIAALIAVVLLTTAIVVPLSILFTA
ncbi:fibronectin-like [Dreissena polymorpha]